MGAATAALDKGEVMTGMYASVKIGDHVINTTNGSQVEFVTEEGKTILVHVRSGVKGDPLAISRAFLSGDGKTARTTEFHDYIILPAQAVIVDGKVVRDKDYGEANAVAYNVGQRRLISLYPAVYWRNGMASKHSPAVYRAKDRSHDQGVLISDIKVSVPDIETPESESV